MSNSRDQPPKNNPSFGLKLWGPLVPANDCKGCLATLAIIQLGAGTTLWFKPKFNPRFRGYRFLTAGRVLLGMYLVFMSGIEFARLALPYDPWVEDARRARNLAKPPSIAAHRSNFNIYFPRSWWFDWFGPANYQAVPWSEWQHRTRQYLDKIEQVKPHFDRMTEFHNALVAANKSTASSILQKIRTGQLPAPEIPIEELQALALLCDIQDPKTLYDDLDVQSADLWDFFRESDAFSVIVVPRSTAAFLPGVKISSDDQLKSQNVTYLPIPQSLRGEFR